ncbi:MAG: ribonuclease P protein component [Dehalococcoidia bacterium]|nr:MAG: ribonuclease P protein component [Dehalococcoidia bacterium]
MRGEEYLKKREQFSLVYNKGKLFKGKLLSLRSMPNGLDFSRYGFIVSKRVGKAVTRNRIKRLLREISRQIPLKPGWDVVFFSGPLTAGADYNKLKETTLGLLLKAQLLLENYETACSSSN